MRGLLTWTAFSRALGTFCVLLGASTWPNIHGEIIIAGLGFLGAPNVFGKDSEK